MIKGAVNWDDAKIRYDQSNNIVENFLEKQKVLNNCNFIYESCNVESASCSIEAVGGEWKVKKPVINGKEFLGYGDLMFDFLNSDSFKNDLPVNSDKFPNNEFIDNLSYCVSLFSDCGSKVHYFDNIEIMVSDMKEYLKAGSSIVLSYKTDYGTSHFITIVAYDFERHEFICYDPWKNNRHCKNGGVKERYRDDFFLKRSRKRFMEVWK